MKHIVLLRGINVGGNNKVPMKALRESLTIAGYNDVQTYIQSGNILLAADEETIMLEKRVAKIIEDTFGFRISVLAKTTDEWQAAIAGNPFEMKKDDAQYEKWLNVTFLKETLIAAQEQKMAEKCAPNERFELKGTTLYLWYGKGQARSKLAEYVSKIPHGTTRNWRTVLKIREMIT